MHPVLAVTDMAAARAQLVQEFGFEADGKLMRLGTQSILLIEEGERPANFIDMPLDHVALSVGDADLAHRDFLARGAVLDLDFTPQGPRDIPQFWERGVRFVFFAGPDAAPLEFCARHGKSMAPGAYGHSHYGIRCNAVDEASAPLLRNGATVLAKYQLPGTTSPVNVAFLQYGQVVLELFDEPPFADKPASRWIGLAEWT